MYLAQKKINRQTHYYIRTTYQDGTCLKSKDVFNLGPDPSRYIIYPGGNAYYFDDIISETIELNGLHITSDELDTIFWDFLHPETQRVIKGFQRSSSKRSYDSTITDRPVHLFDKRRMHYLRFASSDQRNLTFLSDKFFKNLFGKSRDEIEQYFITQERILNPRECKAYVSTIFDLQRCFRQNASVHQIYYMNPDKMDSVFIDSICQLNTDKVFWEGMELSDTLHDYLIKYVIMYFDYDFPSRSPFQDYLNDFRNRHRIYTPPEKIRIKTKEAARLFETRWKELKKMDLRSFNQLYRKLAMKHHPDQGGDPETFIKLTEIYEGLLRKKK